MQQILQMARLRYWMMSQIVLSETKIIVCGMSSSLSKYCFILGTSSVIDDATRVLYSNTSDMIANSKLFSG